MSESGGTTTQSGIFYQNSVTALYLGRLIDSRPRMDSERILEVRAEAPEYIDDFVILHGNGEFSYFQVKEKLAISGEAWNKLWQNLELQKNKSKQSGENFKLILAVSTFSKEIEKLYEICERANGKKNSGEWKKSLSNEMLNMVNSISKTLKDKSISELFFLFQHFEILHFPINRIEKDYLALWMPDSSSKPVQLFRALRDLVGGYARIRAHFQATETLKTLESEYGITIVDVSNWGANTYRQAIQNLLGTIVVPRTALSGPIQSLFLWPKLSLKTQKNFFGDFEEEDIRWRWNNPEKIIDIKDFPRGNIQRAIVNAGAGFGKSTLLQAIAYNLSKDTILMPVIVHLDRLSSDNVPVLDFLEKTINNEFSVNIDWKYLCDVGRSVVLFDGLDELSEGDRTKVIKLINTFAGRFPLVPFLLTVRDSRIISAIQSTKVLELLRFDDEMIEEFTLSYSRHGANITPKQLLDHSQAHKDFSHLLRIPLFLSLVLATKDKKDNLPNSRSEILESYLSLLFSPERHKTQAHDILLDDDLRDVAEFLAFKGLESESFGLNEFSAIRYLKNEGYVENQNQKIHQLVRCGLLRRFGAKVYFSYPIVQEYLAGLWLVRNDPEKVHNLFPLIVQRPWAQALQFALEIHADSEIIFENQLKKPDDAFHTTLRLIARCIVNGAKVGSDLRVRVGEKLADAWFSESYTIQQNIGYLLLDGFIEPLPSEVEKYLLSARSLYWGMDEILNAKSDNDLTLNVLKNYLKQDLTFRSSLRGWQSAVNKIARGAIEIYYSRVCQESIKEEEIASLSSLAFELEPQNVEQDIWENIAKDIKAPSDFRLVAMFRSLSFSREQVGAAIMKLTLPWANNLTSEPKALFLYMRILWSLPNAESYFKKLLSIETSSIDFTRELIDAFTDADIQEENKKSITKNLLKSKAISKDARLLLSLYSSTFTEDKVSVELASNIDRQPFFLQELWCLHLGHYSKKVALLGLEAFKSIQFDSREFYGLCTALSIGLNYVIDPTTFIRARLDKPKRHPVAENFVDWVMAQLRGVELPATEKVMLLQDVQQIGCNGLAEIIHALMMELISDIKTTCKTNSDMVNDYDQAIASALEALSREDYLDKTILLQILEMDLFHSAQEALYYLSLNLDENLLTELVHIYNRMKPKNIKHHIFQSLENASSRLGQRILRSGDKLILTNSNSFNEVS